MTRLEALRWLRERRAVTARRRAQCAEREAGAAADAVSKAREALESVQTERHEANDTLEGRTLSPRDLQESLQVDHHYLRLERVYRDRVADRRQESGAAEARAEQARGDLARSLRRRDGMALLAARHRAPARLGDDDDCRE